MTQFPGRYNYTPGPWEAVMIDDPRGQPVPFYRGLIATVEHGDRYLAVVQSNGRSCSRSEWEPNAKLIARAPAMDDALQTIWAVLQDQLRMHRVNSDGAECETRILACIRECEKGLQS